MLTAAFVLLFLAPPDESGSTPPDIVVVAERGRCKLVYAGSTLDGRALKRLADGWPDTRPLRVVEPRRADRACLTKIMFQLHDKGFNLVEFVDPPAQP